MERAPGWDMVGYAEDAEAMKRAHALGPALIFRKSLILLDFLDEIGLMHLFGLHNFGQKFVNLVFRRLESFDLF